MLSVLALNGCALHATALLAPSESDSLPPDYAWPPNTLSEAEAQHAAQRQAKTAWVADERTAAAPVTPGWAPAPVTPPTGSGGCLAELDRAGAKYDVLGATRGVVTPVKVVGDLGGIKYVPTGGLPLIADCRFAVTLARLGPLLRELGVSEMYYSGAYVYRMSSKGRLSLHANGLAIDVHEITVDGQRLSVKKAFTKGLGDSCESNFPPLNRVACQLKRTGAFKEFLTPDYNADHHDHLHLAIAPEN